MTLLPFTTLVIADIFLNPKTISIFQVILNITKSQSPDQTLKMMNSLPSDGIVNLTSSLPPEVMMEMMESIPPEGLLGMVYSMPLKVLK